LRRSVSPQAARTVTVAGLALLLVSIALLASCARADKPASPAEDLSPTDNGPTSADGNQTDAGPTPRQRVPGVQTWALAIGDGALSGGTDAVVGRLGAFDLVVIDAEETAPDQVAALQDAGTLVLGYLSVGTIEPQRSWYPELEPYATEGLEDWDEYYADVSDPDYRDAIIQVALDVLDKGFDGLFLDNVDMVESHPDHEAAMRGLVSRLSVQVRATDRVLFAQNADEFAVTLAPFLDGWNREDVTFGYDFAADEYARTTPEARAEALAAVAGMLDAGVLVTTTDYVPAAGSAQEDEAVEISRDAGALPYVSDIELERIPAAPFGAPVFGEP